MSEVSKAYGCLFLALKAIESNFFNKRFDEILECTWLEAIDALMKNPNIINALR